MTAFEDLVQRIRVGSEDAELELYALHRRINTSYLKCHYREHYEDPLHDTFISILQSVRSGVIQKPEALPGYMKRTVTLYHWSELREMTANPVSQLKDDEAASCAAPDSFRPDMTFERTAEREVREKVISIAAGFLTPRAQEAIRRMRSEETHTDMQKSMTLTSTQVRLLRSRSVERLRVAVARVINTKSDFTESLKRRKEGNRSAGSSLTGEGVLTFV